MTKAVSNHERMKATPEAKDLSDPRQVWNDGETTPLPAEQGAKRTGMLGRVADFGDFDMDTPSPYEPEIQADMLAQQTEQRNITLDDKAVPTGKSDDEDADHGVGPAPTKKNQ